MTAGRLFLMDREQTQYLDPRGQLSAFEAAPLQPPAKDIKLLQPPAQSLQFTALPFIDKVHLADIRAVHGGRDGIVFMRAKLEKSAAGTGTLLYGADGPVKVWINGKEADCRPEALNLLLKTSIRARLPGARAPTPSLWQWRRTTARHGG